MRPFMDLGILNGIATVLQLDRWQRTQLRKQVRRKRQSTRYRYQPNGARECERRRKQIARGQLTVSNGLVLANEQKVAAE